MPLSYWVNAYLLSFSIEPGRSVESYFPPAPNSSKTRADADGRQALQPTQRYATQHDAAQSVDQAAREPHNSPLKHARPAHDGPEQASDARKRTRTSVAQKPVEFIRKSTPTLARVAEGMTVPQVHAAHERAEPAGRLSPAPSRAAVGPPVQQVERASPPQRRVPSASDERDDELPDTLSHNALHPSVAGLAFDCYRPYLLEQPISPAWLSVFCEAFIRFAMSIAPPDLWSSRPERLLAQAEPPHIVRAIGRREPDKAAGPAAGAPSQVQGGQMRRVGRGS